MTMVNVVRTSEMKPVVHGKWIEDNAHVICSICGATYNDEIFFMYDKWKPNSNEGLEHCPHCGALLDLEADNDT